MIYISSVVGAYVVRTSSLNDKHSCQLFRMGLRDKTTPALTTPLIRTNISCAVNYHLLQPCFSFFVRLNGQPEPFGSCIFSSLALLSSTANLSCLLATTFSNLGLLSNSLSSPRFNLLRVVRRCFSCFLFSYFCVLSSAFLSSVLQCLKLHLL